MNCVNTLEELDNLLFNNYKTKLIMLYFGAPWCGPCKTLKHELHKQEFINTHSKLCTLYIDTSVDDENDKIADMYNINVLPTQIFVTLDKNYKVIETDRIEGLNLQRLDDIYNSYIQHH